MSLSYLLCSALLDRDRGKLFIMSQGFLEQEYATFVLEVVYTGLLCAALRVELKMKTLHCCYKTSNVVYLGRVIYTIWT